MYTRCLKKNGGIWVQNFEKWYIQEINTVKLPNKPLIYNLT